MFFIPSITASAVLSLSAALAEEPKRNPSAPRPAAPRAPGPLARKDPTLFESIQGTFNENLRAIRQAWRGISSVVVARRFPDLSRPPTPAQLGVLGPYPGLVFGAILPTLAGIAAYHRADRTLNSDSASTFEKVGATVAAGEAGVFAGLGIANYVSQQVHNAAKAIPAAGVDRLLRPVWDLLARNVSNPGLLGEIALRTGGVIPLIGGAYSMTSGATHFASGLNQGYIGPWDNAVASGGEVAAGFVSIFGAWLSMARSPASSRLVPAWTRSLIASNPALRNPYVVAGIVIAGGALTLGSPMYHDYKSSLGVGRKIAGELADPAFAGDRIREHLRLTYRQNYNLFNVHSVFSMLEELHDQGLLASLDWRRDPNLRELRDACVDVLHQASQSKASLYKNRIANALLFFGLQSDDIVTQTEAREIFLSRVEKSGRSEQELWGEFIDDYGDDLVRYADIASFTEEYGVKYQEREFKSFISRLAYDAFESRISPIPKTII